MKRSFLLVWLAVCALFVARSIPASQIKASGAPQACASLISLQLPDTTIESAQVVEASSLTPAGSTTLNDLPVLCRVQGITRPAIRFEVWLPLMDWNGKFQGVGNGAMAGTIPYTAMGGAVRRGYATGATDTGHVNQRAFDSIWALSRPDLIADFGYRAIHLTAVNAKQIVSAFYGNLPRYSYFAGCSKGGQQALMEAQRFPTDYDGIIAGDPAYDWTRFYAGGHLWYSLATLKDPESYFPATKVPILADAVNAACDTIDGIKDGILDDPRQCKFDPAQLLCKPGHDGQSCFTDKQVKAVKDIWSGAHTNSGELVFPGLVPGGEAGQSGWASWILGSGPFTSTHWTAADGFFKYMRIPSNPPRTDTRMTRVSSRSKPRIRIAGIVTPIPKAIDSPADPAVWTMLCSSIVASRKPSLESTRKIVIEITATGMDALTVSPTFNTRYNDDAPNTIPRRVPMISGSSVNS